ncbi:hypothetical protein ACH5RR_031122 [Cinchona calisaya]|uniref:Alanyl-transfer RNA synthetases family profile domain-containing protein n=1 Tax=Cinchona calisaya TaxID=153742 RepID=A0ABD2YHS1_9GENT
MAENFSPTKLEYYENMWKLQSTSILLSSFQGEDGRQVLILDSTIFHPQGGGQPADTGVITSAGFKFVVQEVRSKDKIVYHYGFFDNSENEALKKNLEKGAEVLLQVDAERRKLNSRLHSAGHLLDVCMTNVGLGHLEPAKGYHFPDGPFVEYKGTAPQNELQNKQQHLELEANNLIAKGGKVFVATLPYNEAAELCGGCLPDYIPKESSPRIVRLGENPGCPCGGTHVSDLSEILGIKVSQIRTKKRMTKVFYNVES